ncbi:MAG: diphosphomevalonate decarboxylase [bacterium]
MTHILGDRPRAPQKAEGSAFAPSNIALCKYWGKRNEELNLPITPSLSVSLGTLGTHTTVSLNPAKDVIILNDRPVPERSRFAKSAIAYLDLFRPSPDTFFLVRTRNSVPTAAGVASSASGFAALALALNDFFGWDLERKDLSILARLGSGSACRSVYEGFVEWHAGAEADGMDCYAEPIDETWPDLRLGLINVSTAPKDVGSRSAMNRTRRTSALYESWPIKVSHDMALIKEAIRDGHFKLLGKVAESNALAMHATAISAWPPILFWLPESVAVMRRIWEQRDGGLDAYFTMDAGPNVKLLFLAMDTARVEAAFHGIEIATPFPETAPGS